jgi:hypothetical protein
MTVFCDPRIVTKAVIRLYLLKVQLGKANSFLHSVSKADLSKWRSNLSALVDGGGVRGYSTLLILQELMKICGSLEQRDDPLATSSYHPIPFVLSQGSTIIPNDRQRSAKYLPAHYFDYIGKFNSKHSMKKK